MIRALRWSSRAVLLCWCLGACSAGTLASRSQSDVTTSNIVPGCRTPEITLADYRPPAFNPHDTVGPLDTMPDRQWHSRLPDEHAAIAAMLGAGVERGSPVRELLAYVTDVIGPRITGSAAMRRANDWTRERFIAWPVLRLSRCRPVNTQEWTNDRQT